VKALKRLLCVIAVAVLTLSAPVGAAIQLTQIVSGLSSPLFVGHAGDGSGRLFIVERGGVIKVLQPGSTTPTVFLNIADSVQSGGEQGLLGLAFHPLYESNGRFFVFYTRSGGDIVVSNTGGTGSVTVTTAAGCNWTATSGETWITVTDGASGSGPGAVTYSVAPYSGRQGTRNGRVTIAGQVFTVKQSR
jgi:glucose/arabinose dehydrogenase